jgi:ATP-dependent Clp protease ATP-binding subunit ClpA
MSREKISIVMHRNIRCFLPLMVNVEVPVSYQLSTRSGGGPGFGNAMMSDFTPRAKQVLALAHKEAERFKHNYVGTEHLLLGLIKLGQGVAVNVL